MLITRTSRFSGITRTRELPITDAQLARWQAGVVIQQAMPHLSAADREFVLTGITAEEWDAMFPPPCRLCGSVEHEWPDCPTRDYHEDKP